MPNQLTDCCHVCLDHKVSNLDRQCSKFMKYEFRDQLQITETQELVHLDWNLLQDGIKIWK